MEWTYLGHAMWLVVASGLRIVFDPLLSDAHHGGVFAVSPRRKIDASGLRADFILVSHQHPDHFDVASLRRLAALDEDTVVLTADDLVAHAAKRLGFRTVTRLEPLRRVDLDGARLFTTPSLPSGTPEWGVVVAAEGATAWNQVDTVHRDAAAIRTTLAASAAALETRDLASGPGLGLVRWQPLLEVAASIGDATGFPYEAYAEILDQIAATSAATTIPSSAGARHAAPYDGMNRVVYPVPLERALRDIAARAPATHVLPATTGATYRVTERETSFDPYGGASIVDVGPREDQVFRPFDPPPLRDANVDGRDEAVMREVCGAWIRDVLARALAGAVGASAPLRLVVEVVFPVATDVYTMVIGSAGATVERRFDEDYDVLNAVAGSMLYDVIEGRRPWGDPLLAGLLRASGRAYAVGPTGLVRSPVAVTFLYYGLSYAESVRRAVEHALSER